MRLVACALFLSLFAAIASAQTFRGGIQGTVLDASGAGVPGATVTVTSTATGLTCSVQTDVNGNYFFSELPIGLYNVEAALQGFATRRGKGVEVGASASARVYFELAPGRLQQSVDLVARAPLVDTTRNDQGGPRALQLAARVSF
jgi:hypothetical protein